MSNNPHTSQVSLSDDSDATFLIRWRGRQEGPYTAAVIEAKLAANQVGLLHEISYNGQWVTLRDYFAEREAVLRAERQSREEQERRAREEAERQAKEREEQRRADLLVRERQKETVTAAVQTTAPPNHSLAALHKLLVKAFFVVSLLAFFLPNVTISLPILGRVDVSMLDFLSPRLEAAKSDTSKKPPAKPPKPTVQDIGDVQFKKATVGEILCIIAVLALIGHYLLTVVWAALEFGFHKTRSALTTTWLVLALQFPVIFSIGVHIMLSGIKGEVPTEAGADDSSGVATFLGIVFLNNTNIAPGLVMWILMAVALAAMAGQIWQRTMAQETRTPNYGSIPHQS
jgi:hypothetical protein